MGVSAVMETGSVTLWHSLLLLLLLWSSLSSSQSSLVLWTYFPVCTHERCSITGLEHSPHHRGTNWGRKAKRRHWLDRHWGEKKCLWIVVTFYCEQKQWLVVQVKNTLFLYHKTNSCKCFRMTHKAEVTFIYPWEVFQSARTPFIFVLKIGFLYLNFAPWPSQLGTLIHNYTNQLQCVAS